MGIKSDSAFQFFLPENDQISSDVRQMILEKAYQYGKLQAGQVLKDAKRYAVLHEQFRKDLQQLFGKEKYQRFRQYILQQHESFQKEMEPPKGPEMPPQKKQDLYRMRDKNITSYLKKLEVTKEDLKKIAASYRERFARADRGGLPHKVKPGALVPSSKVPKDILHGKTNPWTVIQPPFPGWSWQYAWIVSGFIFTGIHAINTQTGHLYNDAAMLGQWPPSEDDWGQAGYLTEVGFWYKTKHAGQIEAWIRAEATDVRHDVDLQNCWGWSDSYVSQEHDLTLRTGTVSSAAEITYCKMSWFTEDGYDEGHWNENYLTQGGIYWAHLFSTQSFPANTWVCLWVGSRSYSYCFANDVWVTSFPIARWHIKSVSLKD